MADRQECRCRVLILGHSFVTWLGDFLDEEAVELGGQMVAWCRIGGAMVATLRAELGWQNVENYCRLHCVSPTRQSVSLKPGCLQLLEILEISWNLKTLLEILEISWNLNGPPGNFCVLIENYILWLMALLHDDVALFVH